MGGEPFFHVPLSTIYKMSVHIHLSLADFFKMATVDANATASAAADGVAAAAASDAAAAARVAQEAAHQEELKELRQLIEQQKMEIRRLNQESFASSIAVSQVCDAKIKELTDKLHHADADGVAAAAASDAAAAARVAQEATHQEELKELRQLIEQQKMEITHLKWDSFAAAAKERAAFDIQIKDLNDRLNDAVYQHGVRAKEDAATIRHLRTALDDVLEAEQDAQETAYHQKAELERMNARAEEVAREKKVAYNDLASRFDTSTTFYKMKLEEAEEVRARLEKQLKEEGETLEEVSRRECALGETVREQKAELESAHTRVLATEETIRQLRVDKLHALAAAQAAQVSVRQLKKEGETLEEVSRRECALAQKAREATLRAEKVEAEFLRLCGAIDIAMKAYPHSRKELWDHYMSTA